VQEEFKHKHARPTMILLTHVDASESRNDLSNTFQNRMEKSKSCITKDRC
jgi:hypothetical protein